MNNIRASVYKLIPKKFRKRLGASKFLKPFRDVFFRNKQGYRELQVSILKSYGNYKVSFQFVSSIQIATKAKERGIESKLLNHTMSLLKKYKPRAIEDYIIADVGANFGFLSLVWANTVANKGKVFAFEPHHKIFDSFKKSINLNKLDTIISSHNAAVGKEKGAIEISLANTTSNIKEDEIPIAQLRSKAKIEMISLDDFFKDSDRLDLVKIDVDGIELEILNGATETIQRLKPIFVVETNGDRAIYDFFQKQGYSMLDMKLQPFDINFILPLNIFCIPN